LKEKTKKYLKEIYGSNDYHRFVEGHGKCTKDQLLQSLANAELELKLMTKTFNRMSDEIDKLVDMGYIDEMVAKTSEHYEQDKEYFPFIFAVHEGYPFRYYDFQSTKDENDEWTKKGDYGYARILQWHGGKFADKLIWWDLFTNDWINIEHDKDNKDCKQKKVRLPQWIRERNKKK
tara:strand:+ start:6947 stop:7474 length:528 start_codon:yes stop_codon:yes gene_type:complete